MKLHVLSILALALLGAQPASAQRSVDVTVGGTIMSPIALAEMKILTEGSFGSVARSPARGCIYTLKDNNELSFYGPNGTQPQAPGFTTEGCGALNDNVVTPTISFTCPVGMTVNIRTRRETFNSNDTAQFNWLRGSGDDFQYVYATRTSLPDLATEFGLYCYSANDGQATRTVTLYGETQLYLEAGTPETDESFSVTLPLEIQY